jgi:hypothetical protein
LTTATAGAGELAAPAVHHRLDDSDDRASAAAMRPSSLV